jgi:aromatic ring-opening dioxygenase LigB subunit
VAFIASADTAHSFLADSHFGYDPAAGECDATIIQAIRDQRLERLLDLDTALVAGAKTEAVEPLLVLHGVTESLHVQSEVLSYEVPTYFGMLCATYTPERRAVHMRVDDRDW